MFGISLLLEALPSCLLCVCSSFVFYWVRVLESCFCWVHVLHVRFSWIHVLCLSCVFVLLLCIGRFIFSFVLLGLCFSFALIGMCFSFMLSLGFMFLFHVIIVPFLYDVSIFFLHAIIALPLRCVHIFLLCHYCVFPLCYIYVFLSCYYCTYFYNTSVLFICVTFTLLMPFFHYIITYVFNLCVNVAFVLVLHTNVMPFLCVVIAFVFFLRIVIVPFFHDIILFVLFPLHYCYAFPLHFFGRYMLLCTIVMFYVLPSHCCNVYVLCACSLYCPLFLQFLN